MYNKLKKINFAKGSSMLRLVRSHISSLPSLATLAKTVEQKGLQSMELTSCTNSKDWKVYLHCSSFQFQSLQVQSAEQVRKISLQNGLQRTL